MGHETITPIGEIHTKIQLNQFHDLDHTKNHLKQFKDKQSDFHPLDRAIVELASLMTLGFEDLRLTYPTLRSTIDTIPKKFKGL